MKDDDFEPSLTYDDNRVQSRLLNRFIGRSQQQRACRLCTREYALLRRKNVCSWCALTVCSNCSTRRIQLPADVTGGNSTRSPTKPQRVCDACFGLLSGSVNEEAPRITRE